MWWDRKKKNKVLRYGEYKFSQCFENEQKNNLLKENLNIKKAAGFSTVSIFGILRLINVKNNTSYSRSAWEVLVQQMMS